MALEITSAAALRYGTVVHQNFLPNPEGMHVEGSAPLKNIFSGKIVQLLNYGLGKVCRHCGKVES
jgi:hypothetical protein